MAREDESPHVSRNRALFLAGGRKEARLEGRECDPRGAITSDPDTEVKKKAVFRV